MKYYTKDQLTNSRIFFEKNPPRYITIFILGIIALITVSVVCSMKITKLYVVRGEGIINTESKEYIVSKVSGSLLSIKKPEGSYVKQGEVILNIENKVDNKKNSMRREELLDELKSIELMIKSVNEGKNYLKNNNEQRNYYISVENYFLNIESILGNDSKININESVVEENEVSSQEIRSNKENLNLELKRLKNEMLYNAEINRKDIERQIEDLKAEQKDLEELNESYEIKADKDGEIHYYVDTKKGNVIQENQMIAEIANSNDSLVVNAKIPAQDIYKLKEGQAVLIEVQGINIQKFGLLEGKIKTISNAAGSIGEMSDVLYYDCVVTMNDSKIISGNEVIEMVNSMPVLVQVVYDKESYFDWFIDTVFNIVR